MKQEHKRSMLGCVCILAGLYPLLLGIGAVTGDPEQIHAPLWVIAAAGFIFIVAGCMLFLSAESRLNDVLAGLFCLTFAAVSAWVSLFGSSEQFSGGVPFIPAAVNVTLARVMFGLGSLLCLGITGLAIRRALRHR